MVVSVRFGSVSVSSIWYRPGSVPVRFRFLRFLVDFGSVRFGVWNILRWYLFFFPASEKQIQIASRKRFIAQAFLGAEVCLKLRVVWNYLSLRKWKSCWRRTARYRVPKVVGISGKFCFCFFRSVKKANQMVFLSPSFCHLVFRPFPSPLSHPLFLPLAELGKTKLPEIVSACKFLLKNPIFAFSIELKKQLQFSNQFIRRGSRRG